MIAACPRCAARYRVDPEKVGPQGARLRCAKCETVFRVRIPQALPPPPVSAVAETSTPVLPVSPFASQKVEAPSARPPGTNRPRLPAADRDLLVLIADSEIEAGKRTAAAVASWGLQPILVHDGVEAMLTIQRMGPRAVVLDAVLPKMFGFQICEVVKRNESLRDTHVVLVGAVHDRERSRRASEERYGADVYIERPDLPEGLAPVLRRLGLALEIPEKTKKPVLAALRAPIPMVSPTFGDTPVPQATPAPAPMQAPVEVPAPVPEASVPRVEATPSADSLDDERAKAERLARIIVSDIVLYNPEKFDEAVKVGDVIAVLDPALQEGRELFRQRIDERVRGERDYLGAELRRVASEQGAQ